MAEERELTGSEMGGSSSGAELAEELKAIAGTGEAEQSEAGKGEVRKDTGFDIRVDHEKIAELKGVPEEMKEWMGRLPESLSFHEPVTLIVGENGSGKTQFARAIVGSLGEGRENSDIRSQTLGLEPDEPASAIAPALSPAVPPQGNLVEGFFEGAEIMYKSREWAKQQAQMARQPSESSMLGDGPSGSVEDTHRLSSRQLFEQSLAMVKRMRVDSHRERVLGTARGQKEALGGDVVIVFDEPEQGLSPQRQMDLPAVMTDFPDEGDTLLVPTNNLALYLSDLPRLDISQPERGVYRPSDFGESGKIEFHQKG